MIERLGAELTEPFQIRSYLVEGHPWSQVARKYHFEASTFHAFPLEITPFFTKPGLRCPQASYPLGQCLIDGEKSIKNY